MKGWLILIKDKRTFIGLITRVCCFSSIDNGHARAFVQHVMPLFTIVNVDDSRARWTKETLSLRSYREKIIIRLDRRFERIVMTNIVEASNSRKSYNILTFKKKKKNTTIHDNRVIEQTNNMSQRSYSNKCKKIDQP